MKLKDSENSWKNGRSKNRLPASRAASLRPFLRVRTSDPTLCFRGSWKLRDAIAVLTPHPGPLPFEGRGGTWHALWRDWAHRFSTGSGVLTLGLLLTAVGLAALTGCATRDGASSPPQPRNGIAEYGEIVAASQKALGAALQSLEQVGAQTQSCPPKLCAAFASQVQGLQVESMRVRARSQAILARGDAYFEHWQENLARMKDARVKELAEKHRPELQQHFASIKGLAQKSGDTFRPFLANLRSLQGGLDSDPGRVATDATKGLIQATKEKGREVEQLLASIAGELKAMTVILTPAKP